jgi:hypothetical protein
MARYSHVMAGMRRQIHEDLTRLWEAVLAERRAMAAGPPVAVLDRLLRTEAEMTTEIVSRTFPSDTGGGAGRQVQV